MGRFFRRGSILGRILIVSAGALACAWVHTPVALAQYGRAHVGVAGHAAGPHVVAAQTSRATNSRPRALAPVRFGFRHPIYFVRYPLFFGAPFFSYEQGLQFESLAWVTCGPLLRWGLGCNGLPLDENGFENYVTPLPIHGDALYWYGGVSNLVQLYLKDGEVYSVTDYWFVNDQIHFTMLEGGTRPAEQVIDLDELDLQSTIDVNTRRGFRFVMRDEPWPQYLRDHPDLTPPDVAPPQKN
jgi:hypothetical protein